MEEKYILQKHFKRKKINKIDTKIIKLDTTKLIQVKV